mmetsp:Transcript_57402/g.133817  ORF Transcript_57402/g.133817 Transcript_57402/m.133817 type:complete len:275 (-) Transcript_57402:273-1097(-)
MVSCLRRRQHRLDGAFLVVAHTSGVEGACALCGVQHRPQRRSPQLLVVLRGRREPPVAQGLFRTGPDSRVAVEGGLQELQRIGSHPPAHVQRRPWFERWHGRPSQDGCLHGLGTALVRLVWELSKQDHVADYTQGPNVRRSTVSAAAKHLWGHEGRGPVHSLQVAIAGGKHLCKAEVAELNAEPLATAEEIVRLHISVNHLQAVYASQGLEHLFDEAHERVLRQFRDTVQCLQERPVAPLHHDVGEQAFLVVLVEPHAVCLHANSPEDACLLLH